VTTADGHTYERAAIDRWLQDHNKSPKTNLELANKILTPNPWFPSSRIDLEESEWNVNSLRCYFPKSAAFLDQRGTLKITKVGDTKIFNVIDLMQSINYRFILAFQ